MRLNALFRAKNAFLALYRPLTQWKHWETCKRIELCRIRLTRPKTNISLRLNAFLSKDDVKCAKTRYFALTVVAVLTQWKHWETCKRIELCRIRLTRPKTSIFLHLNPFLSKNDVKCAKTRYFALKTRFFCTLSVLTQWKHCETCKSIELCRIRLTRPKICLSLRLYAFFSKNDINGSKTR